MNKSKSTERFINYLYTDNKCFDNILPQTAARTVLLATTIPYTTRDVNNMHQTIPRQTIIKTLNLCEGAVDNYIKESVEKEYLIRQSQGYSISNDYFVRGKNKIKFSTNAQKRSIRIFIEPYRKLYKALLPSEHIYLGYTLRLIPYLNIKWNILCSNPTEQNIDFVVPLSMNEVCQILKFSGKQSTRFFNKLYSITFPVEDRQETLYYRDKTSRAIYINPRVMYAGDGIEPDIQNNFLTTERSTAYGAK